MSFAESVRSVFTNYAKFDGRASRSEFWWFQLFNLLVVVAIYVVIIAAAAAGRSYAVLSVGLAALVIYTIATFIPGLAVLVRRLHDTDRSGWWLLISLVPYVGAIVLLVFLVMPSTIGINQFGPPYGMAGDVRRVNYRAPTPEEAWARYTEDAARAVASGYQPVSQQWRRDGLGDYLEVVYTTAQQTQWLAPAPGWHAPPPGPGPAGPGWQTGASTAPRNPLDGPPPERSDSA